MKTTHGGKRENAGRKPREDGRTRRLVSINLTSAELEQVKRLSPDVRREILLGRIGRTFDKKSRMCYTGIVMRVRHLAVFSSHNPEALKVPFRVTTKPPQG